jgi:hypothetical protein
VTRNVHKLTNSLRDSCEIVRRQGFVLLAQLLQVGSYMIIKLLLECGVVFFHLGADVANSNAERLSEVERNIVPPLPSGIG